MEKFKNQEKRCNMILHMIFDRFKNHQYGTPSQFNTDLPYQVFGLLKEEVFAKMLYAKNFQTMEVLRDETS